MIRLLILCLLPITVWAHSCRLTLYTYATFASLYGPFEPLQSLFNKKTGCTLKAVTFANQGELLTRLKLEGDHTQADVIIGLDNLILDEAIEAGLIKKHALKLRAHTLPAPFISEYMVPYQYTFPAFISHSHVGETGKNFADFAKGKGSLIIPDPRISAPAHALVVWMHEALGQQEAEIWHALKERLVTMPSSWSQATTLFMAGESDTMLSYATFPLHKILSGKKDAFKTHLFEEGHLLIVEGAALSAYSKNLTLGCHFLNLLTTEDAQKAIAGEGLAFPAYGDLPAAWKPYLKDLMPKRFILPKTIYRQQEKEALLKAWAQQWK